jgi:hypothetical protein
MPEPRSPVMILVEATWEDQSGTLQTARACMVNPVCFGNLHTDQGTDRSGDHVQKIEAAV